MARKRNQEDAQRGKEMTQEMVRLLHLHTQAKPNRVQDLLEETLQVAVPLWVDKIQREGGPSVKDWTELPHIADEIGEHGDVLLFQGKKKGETARMFNLVARTIAVMSFLPGGITCFGSHWENKTLNA